MRLAQRLGAGRGESSFSLLAHFGLTYQWHTRELCYLCARVDKVELIGVIGQIHSYR